MQSRSKGNHTSTYTTTMTIIDNSKIVNVEIFSISMMQSRSEWNLRSFKFWDTHHHRHHGLHVAESDLMGLLEGGEDKRQVLAADHSHQPHSLHLHLHLQPFTRMITQSLNDCCNFKLYVQADEDLQMVCLTTFANPCSFWSWKPPSFNFVPQVISVFILLQNVSTRVQFLFISVKVWTRKMSPGEESWIVCNK